MKNLSRIGYNLAEDFWNHVAIVRLSYFEKVPGVDSLQLRVGGFFCFFWLLL